MTDICTEKHNHQNLKQEVLNEMPGIDEYLKLAELFKAFSDVTRIKVLYVLIHHEACVCDIAQIIGASSSVVSHQLSYLKMAGLVKYRREGKTVWYSLSDNHVKTILDMGIEHINE